MVINLDINDTVTFPHCVLERAGIRDHLTAQLLPLNAVARHVISRCDGTRPLHQVADSMAREFDVTPAEAAVDLLAFIGDAERFGLIRVRRDLRSRLSPSALGSQLQELLALRATRRERRRYPTTVRGVVGATLRSARLTLWACVLTVPLLALALSRQPGAQLAAVIGAALAPLATVLFVSASIAVHELGHVLLLPGAVRATAYVHTMGMQVGVVRPSRPGTGTALAAFAGPVAAATVCAFGAVALQIARVPPHGLALVPLVMAAAHLASLLPWAHDGRALLATVLRRPDPLQGASHA
jgi:hypothetical protein